MRFVLWRLHPRVTGALLAGSLALCVGTLVLLLAALWPYRSISPCNVDQAVGRLRARTTFVDHAGRVLDGADRYVSLERLPPHVPQAFVAVEDRRLHSWYHQGVDPLGALAAVRDNLRARRSASRGASTIAMQLAQALCGAELLPDHTWQGKKAEALLALHLTRRYGDDEVVELYLNSVYLGRGVHGVDAAAQEYFGKRAESLTPADAAELAHLVASPVRRDPRREGIAERRRAVRAVFTRMSRVHARYPGGGVRRLELSRLTTISAVRRLQPLANAVRASLPTCNVPAPCPAQLHTFIDQRLQRIAMRAVDDLTRRLERRRGAVASGVGSGRVEGLFVAMDVATGRVRAYVPRRSDNVGGVDLLRDGLIQPSSTLKGVLLAMGIDAGVVQPTTTIGALLLTGCRSPESRTYARSLSGGDAANRSLRDAVEQSDNAIAPCMLDALPLEHRERLVDAGILTSAEAPAVDGMGIQGVAPVDLLSAYAALFNEGVRPQARFSVEERQRPSVRMLSTSAARETEGVLREVVRRGTAARAGRWLAGGDVAGKTGTAQGGREMLFVGRRGRIVSLLWVGIVGGTGSVARGSAGTVVVEPWAQVWRERESGRGGRAGGAGAAGER